MKDCALFTSFHQRKRSNEIDECPTISKHIQPVEVEQKIESKEPILKCRYTIAILGFCIYFFMGSYRTNLSVTIVAMVNHSAFADEMKGKSESCLDLLPTAEHNTSKGDDQYQLKDGELNWSPEMQGYFLGSYYLSFLTVLIPAGKIVERYGGKWFLFGGSILSAVGTLAVPYVARLNFYALIVLQLIRGLSHGAHNPAAGVLLGNWFPRSERGPTFTFMQSGISFGGCLGFIFSGLLCKSDLFGGWSSSFYAFGIAGLLMVVATYFLCESPNTHPHISKEELHYILSNQERSLSQRRPNVPWGQILRSVPAYALVTGVFGLFWAQSQFLIVHSTFLGTILHNPIKQNGYFSALPFLCMFLGSIAGTFLSRLTTRKNFSVTKVRKFWNFLASAGFSACMLGIYCAGCNRSQSIIFSILSAGFMGFGASGALIVSADMAPTFTASLNAVCLTIGCLPTFILPLAVGYLTNGMQTIEQWNKVFFVSIGVVMTCAVVFQLFGSAEVQPWNYVEDPQKTDNSKESR